MYSVKEVFYSLQGEGYHSGKAALFCRFSGCNLWSGREQDRQSSICNFCDTDFIGTDGQNGGKFETAELLLAHLNSFWPQTDQSHKFVIFTGGEPALQLDQELVDCCHKYNFKIAIETNGTKPLPLRIDWICVSPKADAELVIVSGQELKLIYPQPLAQPERFQALDFEHFYLQPMDSPMVSTHQQEAVHYCLQNPKWQLSLQTHKILGID